VHTPARYIRMSQPGLSRQKFGYRPQVEVEEDFAGGWKRFVPVTSVAGSGSTSVAITSEFRSLRRGAVHAMG